jgi:hypothetical protein
MYKFTAKFVEDEDEGVTLGGSNTLPVDLIIGDEDEPAATIRFELPEPDETERVKFTSESTQLRQPKGGKKNRTRIVTDLKASVKFFDELMSRAGADIQGATVQGKSFAELASSNPMGREIFLKSIDPMYKRIVISAALSRYNAKVSD